MEKRKMLNYVVDKNEHKEFMRIHKLIKKRFGSIEKILPFLFLDVLHEEEKNGFDGLKKYL